MGGIAILRRIFKRRKAAPPPVQITPAPVASATVAQTAPALTTKKKYLRQTIMTSSRGVEEEANVRRTTLG